jgi:hypothetical protein
VTGEPRDAEAWTAARWNHPERGLVTSDPVLARGNLSLLESLGSDGPDDPAARLLSSSWRRLELRDTEVSPFEAIDAAARAAAGLPLTALQQHAAAARIAAGDPPARWGARMDAGGGTAEGLPVAPSGLAMIRIHPGPGASRSDATLLELNAMEGPWQATLLAQRRAGGWDRTRLPSLLPGETDARFEVEIPWHDYASAVLLLARDAGTDGWGAYGATAGAGTLGGRFALSSLSAVMVGTHAVELRWDTTRERGLFGWFVERAPSADGPFSRIGVAPLPSFGEARSGSHYRVVDEGPDVGPDTFYRVVALTRDGLRISGPAVAVGR